MIHWVSTMTSFSYRTNRPLAAIAATEPVPGTGGGFVVQHLRMQLTESDPDDEVAPHRDDVAQALIFQSDSEVVIGTVDRVGSFSLDRNARGHGPLDHPLRHNNLGRERCRRGHASRLPPHRLPTPSAR